ncbi:MAG: hypothetical protein Q8R60_13300 [Mycobacteriales bacterium]|nr:hypothetical protein [Mycobacteriales bacterium]
MLQDLKSFIVGSSVAEVGVGLSIGAAFTAVVAQATDAGQAAFRGEWEFDGLLKALIALVTVAVISLVGVIKPLMGLRRRAAAAAVTGEHDATDALDASSAGPQVAEVVTADGEVQRVAEVSAVDIDDATSGAELTDDAQADGDRVHFDADPLFAPLPTRMAAGSVNGAGSVVLSGTSAAMAAASVQESSTDPAGEFVTDPVVDLTDGAGRASAPGVTAAAGAAPSGVPGSATPFRATELVACPHCAFDVPAAATRCGWCTSDLRVDARI